MIFFANISRFFYKFFLKKILFLFDPEKIHDIFMSRGEVISNSKICVKLIAFFCVARRPTLSQNFSGFQFDNPFGIAGGFDKDARLTGIFHALNFGFMEIGSVTNLPYGGNPRPRLIRFPKTNSIWVNYGLKSLGSKIVAEKLLGKSFKIPLFVNIAKTNCKETVECENAVDDYVKGMEAFRNIANFFTVNISCPNAFGGQPFHDPKDLEKLLTAIDAKSFYQPIFLKISPDLTTIQVDDILKICDNHNIFGIIISNLRKDKKLQDIHESERKFLPEHGGLSGDYLKAKSNIMLKYIALKRKNGECNNYILVGLGGVFDANDAYEKIKLGANLIQLVTGIIFEGPTICTTMAYDLDKLLKNDGFKNINEAVGYDL